MLLDAVRGVQVEVVELWSLDGVGSRVVGGKGLPAGAAA